jgi:hypothetical protein
MSSPNKTGVGFWVTVVVVVVLIGYPLSFGPACSTTIMPGTWRHG